MPTRRNFIGSLPAALIAVNSPFTGATTPPQAAEKPVAPLDVVSRHKAVFTSPPTEIPSIVSVDAPFLGNGDLIAAFAGPPEAPQLWLTLNDFWQLRLSGGPRLLGRLVLSMPSLAGASYLVEQDLATATTTSRFQKAVGPAMTISSWISATENLLVLQLTADNEAVEVTPSLLFPNEVGFGSSPPEPWSGYPPNGVFPDYNLPVQEKSWDGEVLSAVRTFEINVDQPTRAAMAARFVGSALPASASAKVIVEPGKPRCFVAALRSWFKHSHPLPAAQARVRSIRSEEIQSLRQQHESWWRAYWSLSSVEVGDPAIEHLYYLSHYNMGSFSRDPEFPPCIFGITGSDGPEWCGDHKINYNYQASFNGLNVAGRFEQTAPYPAPMLAHLDDACAAAWKRLNHGGAYMSIGLGQKGQICEDIYLGMKSCNGFVLANFAERWYLTRDNKYARRVYPLVRETAAFWEADLRFANGRYEIVDDAAQEILNHHSINCSAGIAFVRLSMLLALELSEELGVDAEKREKWRDVLAHLSPLPIRDAVTLKTVFESPLNLQDYYPKSVLEGKQVIMLEEQGTDWSVSCSVQTQPIYPGGMVGLNSEPGLLQAARNTVALRALGEEHSEEWMKEKPQGRHSHIRGAWFDLNHGNLFFPAAVRVGHNPDKIWAKLQEWSTTRVRANGYRKDNPHGIENCSTIPVTLHEMMLLSHENVLRFFHVWPRQTQPNACFRDLWAYGAFRVSAALKNGVVSGVQIVSEKGRACTVENPWPGQKVQLQRDGKLAEEFHGDRFTFTTRSGESIALSLRSGPPLLRLDSIHASNGSTVNE